MIRDSNGIPVFPRIEHELRFALQELGKRKPYLSLRVLREDEPLGTYENQGDPWAGTSDPIQLFGVGTGPTPFFNPVAMLVNDLLDHCRCVAAELGRTPATFFPLLHGLFNEDHALVFFECCGQRAAMRALPAGEMCVLVVETLVFKP